MPNSGDRSPLRSVFAFGVIARKEDTTIHELTRIQATSQVDLGLVKVNSVQRSNCNNAVSGCLKFGFCI